MTFFNVSFWFIMFIFGRCASALALLNLFLMPINPTSRVTSSIAPGSSGGYVPTYDWSSVKWDKYNPYYSEDMAKLIWDSDKSVIRTNRSLAATEAELWQAANNFQSNLYGTQLDREIDANNMNGINTNLEGVKSAPTESEFDPSAFGNSGNERLAQFMQGANDFLGSFSSIVQTGLGIIGSLGASPQQKLTNDISVLNALGGFSSLAERSVPSVIFRNPQTNQWEFDQSRASTWLKDLGFQSPYFNSMATAALQDYQISQKGVNKIMADETEGKKQTLDPITQANNEYMRHMSSIYKTCWDLQLSAMKWEASQRERQGFVDYSQTFQNAKLWQNGDFKQDYFDANFLQNRNDALNLKFVNKFRESVDQLFDGLFEATKSPKWWKATAAQSAIVAAGGLLLPMLQQSKFAFGAFARPGKGTNFTFNQTQIDQ